jgi:SulP family sulfate permease
MGLTGTAGAGGTVQVFPTLEDTVEWVEDKLIGDIKGRGGEEVLLQLQEMELFRGHKDETMVDLEELMKERSFKAGETIYAIGDPGQEIFLIRRGEIRIMAPIGGSRQLHHVATMGRGYFFGGLAFLDGHPRSDTAIAFTDVDLYMLTREQFNQLADEHKRMALVLLSAISRTLAHRLRHANGERTLLRA